MFRFHICMPYWEHFKGLAPSLYFTFFTKFTAPCESVLNLFFLSFWFRLGTGSGWISWPHTCDPPASLSYLAEDRIIYFGFYLASEFFVTMLIARSFRAKVGICLLFTVTSRVACTAAHG